MTLQLITGYRPARRRKAPPWTAQEIAILRDIYPSGGIEAAADALPDRPWRAIQTMASKIGAAGARIGSMSRQTSLAGGHLEAAIAMREDGASFDTIGKRFGVCETAAQNAILIAMCPRKGFVPAERDERRKLTEVGLSRLRALLREGEKGVDISLQLGLSVARIALERRTYTAALAVEGKPPLSPHGNGQRYSGARLSSDVYVQVDHLFMQGYGTARIAEMTQVSKVHVGRRRNKLIARLRLEGRTLPGCDADGRRLAYKDAVSAVPETCKAILRAELLKGTSCARAAKIALIGESRAYQIRLELVADLARQGRTLARPKPLAPDDAAAERRRFAWLPKGKRNFVLYRRILKQVGGDHEEAKRRTMAALMPKPAPSSARPKRPMTFEEQLARVAAGATLVERIPLRRPDYAMTLGGVATGAL